VQFSIYHVLIILFFFVCYSLIVFDLFLLQVHRLEIEQLQAAHDARIQWVEIEAAAAKDNAVQQLQAEFSAQRVQFRVNQEIQMRRIVADQKQAIEQLRRSLHEQHEQKLQGVVTSYTDMLADHEAKLSHATRKLSVSEQELSAVQRQLSLSAVTAATTVAVPAGGARPLNNKANPFAKAASPLPSSTGTGGETKGTSFIFCRQLASHALIVN
jgi:hypothetical protein